MQEKRLPTSLRAAVLGGFCLLLAGAVLLAGGTPGALGAPPRQADDVFLTATSMAATLEAIAATATAQANAAALQTIVAQTTALVEQMTATAAARNPATSTPVPTRTATATRAAPAPTRRPAAPAARAEVESLVQGLNVRSGPGTGYAVVSSAALGQVFPVTGQSGGCAWLRVTLPSGGSGWVSGSPSYTRLYTACGNVPAASAPAAAAAPAAPTARANAAPAAAPAAPAASAARKPATVTTFEPLGGWRRGDQPYGTLEASTAQVADGAAAARLTYDFPAAAGTENYVVFLAQPPLAIPSGATGLRMQVYGDGGGQFLNAWIGDANGQVWQTTFGLLDFRGWDEVSATLLPKRNWPNGPISATSDTLTPPLTLRALVLDSTQENKASAGVLYLDGIVATSLPAAAAPGAAAAPDAAEAAPAAADAAPVAVDTAPAAPAPLTGRIAVPQASGAGVSTLVYDAARGTVLLEVGNARQPDLAGDVLLVNREGGPDTIMRISLATRDERPVTINAEDAYPQWSPSRVSIAYASNKVGDRRWRIYLQEDATDQQDVSPLLVEGNELFGAYPVYLDNWRIAYNGCDTWAGGSRCGIYAADSRGSRPVRVTDSPDDVPSGNLGSRVLFTARRAGNYDVWAANWDGSGLQQLTTDGANDGLGAGSPDGSAIAFVSDRGGGWAVWVMNADGSNQRKAFALPAAPGGPAGWLTERIGWGA